MTRIYLVDDHALMRDGLRAVLEARGYLVVGESADPTEALLAIEQSLPEVLLLDLNLGERSGFELLIQLQQRALNTKTIVLTMSAQPRHVNEALRLGAMGYVLKGASASELTRAIETVRQGQLHIGDQVAELAQRALSEASGDRPALELLSARERQILELVVRGNSSNEIANLIHLSPKTVDSYRSRLMIKLGVSDVTALVRLAIRWRVIDSEED